MIFQTHQIASFQLWDLDELIQDNNLHQEAAAADSDSDEMEVDNTGTLMSGKFLSQWQSGILHLIFTPT